MPVENSELKYIKPPLTFNQQLDLLIERGLKVDDRSRAISHLENISYYRLSAYYLPFKHAEKFKDGISFEDVTQLYFFDKKLRLLVLDAIETIEISLRTKIIYHLGHTYGAFGYLESKNFSPRFRHRVWLENLDGSVGVASESFVSHFKKKYIGNTHMPIWMILELVSFGGLSVLLRGLRGKDQQVISKEYGLTDVVLSSWIHTLVYVRNLCAHHARCWNRTLTVKPMSPGKMKVMDGIAHDRFYFVLSMLQHFLQTINPESTWKERLFFLLKEYPQVPLMVMGFPEDWKKRTIWL